MKKIVRLFVAFVGGVLLVSAARTASAVVATGGNMVNTGTYVIHTFTNAGTTNFTVAIAGNVDVLVVAGGGGGGGDIGGGGGAGGLIYTQSLAVTAGPYTVTVGAGGVGGPIGIVGFRGSNSVFGTLIAYGGGGGGGWNNSSAATPGGSGGGGYSGANGAAGTNTQGNAGGNGGPTGTAYPGGGGGGARSNGVPGTATNGGNGGSGTNLPQFATVGGFPAGWFAGGGGGGVYNNAGPEGQGGNGGGGNGGARAVSNYGSNGVVNTGGGGGGASRYSTMLTGGSGGSGIVIVRYASTIANLAVSNVTLTSATLSGNLVSTNGLPSSVFVYWGTSDGGTVASAWGNTNQFPDYQPLGVLTTNVAGLSSNITYYYTFCLANSAGTNWASPSSVFLPGQVSIVATTPNASEAGPVSGAFTVSRPATATNGNLVVNYTVGGTASNGVDYALLGGSVTIPDGQASATIPVTPNWTQFSAGSQTVQATLAAGPYIIGSQSSDTVTIADYGKRVWSGTGDWTNTSYWSSGILPSDGDAVFVTSGAVLLTNSTPHLAYFAITNSTLTFTNWNTLLLADTLTIQNGGTLQHAQCATNGAPANTNRVYIMCANLTVNAGGAINANYLGFSGGQFGTATPVGLGPGGGSSISSRGGGAGYGGVGANSGAAPGGTYGSASQPIQPGSGGGGGGHVGGNGGGAIWIQATNVILSGGSILANGNTGGGDQGASGSGGGIYIGCSTISGTGSVQALGGWNGGGGGGRIAVNYNSAAQTPQPLIVFSVAGGSADNNTPGNIGDLGSLWFPDTTILSPFMPHSGEFVFPSATSWSPSSLTVSNANLRFAIGFLLTVTNNLTLMQSSTLTVRQSPSLIVGNLLLTNTSVLTIYSPPTNGTTPYGCLVAVTGNVTIATNCTVYPYSDTTNGGSIKFAVGSFTLVQGATVNADQKGYAGAKSPSNGYGPGHGYSSSDRGSGAGYGGKGGAGSDIASVGQTYGFANAPAACGSGAGGGGTIGGPGGGLLWVECSTGPVILNGSVTANGGQVGDGDQGGGGSGGGVYFVSPMFTGTGSIQAKGYGTGSGNSGGGGGGRIAFTGWTTNQFLGSLRRRA